MSDPDDWGALRNQGCDKGETIEEQRRVEGFGDPQYSCDDDELALRHAVYIVFQKLRALGMLNVTMTQDWQGNILHVSGEFRPADFVRELMGRE